jgi:hypothetical protein
MMISACVLGYSKLANEFISRFKSLSYYKKRNSDTEGVRIHTMYVNDPDLLDRDYVCRYELKGSFANVLADGTEKTNKESSIGNDLEWLISSNGHDTIFEATDEDPSYLDTLVKFASRGYWVILTSEVYKNDNWEILVDASRNGMGMITKCNSISDLFVDIDLEYKARLDIHRKNLYEESLTAKPCGLP